MTRSSVVFVAIIVVALVIGIGLSVVKPMLDQRTQQDSVAATANFVKNNITTLKIVYGTEKEEWFRDAITRFDQ
ncbi:MAG TPA: hypothetical protein VKQ72_17050, partial [Aggregatilineales bacterium]|nr:hypothetical protein [Aggregatilineales bacterium]